MPRPDTDVRLLHLLDTARAGVHMAQGKTRADWDAARPLDLSLVRLLEIVGLRNRRIHGYDDVDFDIITDMPMVPKAVIARRERS